MSIVESLQKKIELAQESVSNIADEKLKAVAFQLILERLLKSDELPDLMQEELIDSSKKEDVKTQNKDKQPKGTKGRIEALIDDSFFNQKRTINEVKDALEGRGWFYKMAELSTPLVRLVQEKKLRRIKEPEKEGGKLIWRYSNW